MPTRRTRQNTFEIVRGLLSANFGVAASKIDEYTRITDDLNADSLDIVEVQMYIEDELRICIKNEAIDSIGDGIPVGKLVDLVHSIRIKTPEPVSE